jgi:hypothetical protein
VVPIVTGLFVAVIAMRLNYVLRALNFEEKLLWRRGRGRVHGSV